jgi:acyl dehydratase
LTSVGEQTPLTALAERVGQHLGYSRWLEVTQERINRFADATGDHQWLHVDVERAHRGPFGSTVAHGFLTLSLVSGLLYEIVDVSGPAAIVNYGVNRVRFPAPVRAGSRVRLGAEVASVDEMGGGVQVALQATVEVEGEAKPACVAELLLRYYE